MSNTNEKMNRLREKLLDRALTAFMSPTEKEAHFADTGEKAADLDEARWVMENVQGVVSAKEPESPKVGSNAAPPASDVDALALKSAKEMLVKLGHANVTDETAAAFRDWKAEDWETWKRLKGPLRLGAYYILDCRPPAGDTLLRTKKEGLDLFMAQGFPSLDETLDVLVRRGRPIGAGALLRALGFPDLARVATESFPCAGSAKGADKNGRKHEVLVEGACMRDSFVALFRWNEAADASNKVRLPDTISAKSLCEFACARDGFAFKMFTGKSPEIATPTEVVGWINEANLYPAFAEWERLSRSKVSDPAKSSEEKTYWFVPSAPLVLTTGTHPVYGEGGDFETKSAIGGASASRSPIPLRAKSGPFWTKGGKVCLYQRTAESAPGHVFDCLVSAKAHHDATTPAKGPEPVASHWFVPQSVSCEVAIPAGKRVFSSSSAHHFEVTKTTVLDKRAPVPVRALDGGHGEVGGLILLSSPLIAGMSSDGELFPTLEAAEAACAPKATHWFVPAAAFEASEAGHRVTQNGSNVAFYTLASDRAADRSPIPLRLDPSQAGHGSLVGVWRLYKPGVSVAGAVFPTLASSKAALAAASARLAAFTPKKVRYGLLDASIAGPSALTIVETADGIPVAITVRDFAPGPLLGTMLHVVAMCFRLGITDLYGDSYREKEVTHALATIATFLRGEALHDLSEGDRASFLRMTTTIEWPRTYYPPTFKVLPPL